MATLDLGLSLIENQDQNFFFISGKDTTNLVFFGKKIPAKKELSMNRNLFFLSSHFLFENWFLYSMKIKFLTETVDRPTGELTSSSMRWNILGPVLVIKLYGSVIKVVIL